MVFTPRRSNLPYKGLDGCGVYIILAASHPGASKRIRERLGFWFRARYHGKGEEKNAPLIFSFTLPSVHCVHSKRSHRSLRDTP